MIKRFLWHSKAAQETQQCSLVWYGCSAIWMPTAGFWGLAKLFSTELQEVGKDYLCHCHKSQIHTGWTDFPYQRKVPSLSYGVSEGLWSAKHNEVQNWNFPNCRNITLCFISYHLFLPFEVVRHHYLYRTPSCSFRAFWLFETKQEWKQIYFLALNLKA